MLVKLLKKNYPAIIRNFLRKCYLKRYVTKLKNKSPCIISSNCNGACILHDLGLRFNSPFVNLWLGPKDFIKMLKSLRHYMACELRFVEDERPYPVGMLDDIKIYFMHYKTREEVASQWRRRVSRMNYENLFVMFSDQNGCTDNDLKEFDNLPYEHKVVFVHKPCPDVKSAFVIKGFENEQSVGTCSNFRRKFSLAKYYDDFDYVGWLNSKCD